MPGMAASPKIFEFLKLPDRFDVIYLSWFPPFDNEPLSNYANRMCKLIKHRNPILLGVSFGGILAQEMAKYIKCKKVIIVSSIKSRDELPKLMKISSVLGLNKLIPSYCIKNIETLISFSFGSNVKRKFLLYQKYFTVRDPKYLLWAINCIVNWQGIISEDKLIHIHGNMDKIFKKNKLLDPYIEIKGDHAIIITRHEWFNNFLSKKI